MSNETASLVLERVRLSFCHVFEKGSFEGKESSKFECSALFSKTDDQLKEKVRRLIVKALLNKYGTKDKIPKQFKSMVDADKFGSSDKVFLRDGDDSDYDGYEGMWSVKAASKARPPLFSLDRTPILSADDGMIYSGAYADMLISVWIQDNAFGKRINANLDGIRFRAHGEPLSGSGGVRATADSFAEIEDEEAEELAEEYDDL